MIQFADTTYKNLPATLYVCQPPVPVASPKLVVFNEALAATLPLAAATTSEAWAQVLGGNSVPTGATPLAMAYAGHQFGHFVPQLGDGRALLLGEVLDNDGVRRDVHLKGSGVTPYSRRGDGRCALAPALREYVIAEAMSALGIPTTRSLAVVTTGESVLRETPQAGAVLTRIASSHVRVGTFQYAAIQGDWQVVAKLAQYVRVRHYPEAASPAAMLAMIITRQAHLVAQWLCVGFIHGVMNTDNMSIAGETIDYGPCAFMDNYDPQTVFSAIDQQGRYAYANQPTIAQWNLSRLAECMLPLLDKDEHTALEHARAALAMFAPQFEAAWQAGMRRKLGLQDSHATDRQLIGDLLQAMQQEQLDYTNTFAALTQAAAGAAAPMLLQSPLLQAWLPRWQQRLKEDSGDCVLLMQQANPQIIPRNHRVAQALAAAEQGDYQPFLALHEALAHPFAYQPQPGQLQPGQPDYAAPPAPHERVLQTFCGT